MVGGVALGQAGIVDGPGVTGDGVGQELVGFLTGQADDVEALGRSEFLHGVGGDGVVEGLGQRVDDLLGSVARDHDGPGFVQVRDGFGALDQGGDGGAGDAGVGELEGVSAGHEDRDQLAGVDVVDDGGQGAGAHLRVARDAGYASVRAGAEQRIGGSRNASRRADGFELGVRAVAVSADGELVRGIRDVLEHLVHGGDAGIGVREHDCRAGVRMEGDPILPAGIGVAIDRVGRESAGAGGEQVVAVVLLAEDVVAGHGRVRAFHVGAGDVFAEILGHRSDHRTHRSVGSAAGAVADVHVGRAVRPDRRHCGSAAQDENQGENQSKQFLH